MISSPIDQAESPKAERVDFNQWNQRDRMLHAQECQTVLRFTHGITTDRDGHYSMRIDKMVGQAHMDVLTLIERVARDVCAKMVTERPELAKVRKPAGGA